MKDVRYSGKHDQYSSIELKKIEYKFDPFGMSLVVTDKCTAACKSCCFHCSPKGTDKMTLKEAKSYIKNAVESFDSLSLLIITGGEPFLLGLNVLEELLKYAKSFNLITRIVTNGYWAKSLNKANEVLERLVCAGLDELNLSTGDEHQAFVNINNIVYAAIESVKLNLTTVINVESHLNSNFNSDSLFEIELFNDFFKQNKNSEKLKIMSGLWSDLGKADIGIEHDPELLKITQENKKGCDSIFKTFAVFPDGKMTSCCGLTVKEIKELHLGNMNSHTAKDLYDL